jgi:O-antigen/teichoic acid export membrane protein
VSPGGRLIFGLPLRSFQELISVVGVYAVANFLGALLPFALLPLFTRHMPPADYGIMSMYQVLVAILTPVVGLSLQGAVGRRHVDRESIDFPLYVAVCLKLAFVSWGVTCVLLFVFSAQIGSITSFPTEWLWAPMAVAGSQAIIQILLAIWQMEGRPYSYASLQCLLLSFQFGLSFYLVVHRGASWKGAVVGQSLTATLFALAAFIMLWRENWIRRGFEAAYVRHALKFGLPLVPHVLGAWILTMVDRIFVTKYVGLEEAGVYAVGVQVGLAMSLLTTSFNQGWVPWLFARLKLNAPAEQRQIVIFTYWYCLGLVGLAGAIGFSAPYIIPILVGHEYAGAARFIPWVALGYAFNGMYKIVTNYIFFVEKTHLLAWVTLAAGLLNVALSYALIRMLGAIGGAYAAVISFMFSFFATWALSARVYPMPWNLFRKVAPQ